MTEGISSLDRLAFFPVQFAKRLIPWQGVQILRPRFFLRKLGFIGQSPVATTLLGSTIRIVVRSGARVR
jgi:hypothetical protein